MSNERYYGRMLEVDLTTMVNNITIIPDKDIKEFIGGRGLGAKILYDRLKSGTDPLSPDNILLFMPGPFSGLPIPSSSRTCVLTKSPRTSPVDHIHKYGSTISYSNMGGFFGPELRFAGYDALLITGKAEYPVYIKIDNNSVTIEDARTYWGKGIDFFYSSLNTDTGKGRWESCYIGEAGENLVPMASILNSSMGAAGRGGTGCVMGSKNLKAVIVRGTKKPNIANIKEFNFLLKKARESFRHKDEDLSYRKNVVIKQLPISSTIKEAQAEKFYSEGLLNNKKKSSRDYSCYSCRINCKKSIIARDPNHSRERERPQNKMARMLEANLRISDPKGLHLITDTADGLGIDIVSVGNSIGFLMEAYSRGDIDLNFLGGIDLNWGNVEATIEIMNKISRKEGIGKTASLGVLELARIIGKGSFKYAVHVKGHELATWKKSANVANWAVCYATSNRGGCHMNGGSTAQQNDACLKDSLGACNFASSWYSGDLEYRNFLKAITGLQWSRDEFSSIGERIFNLEKMFNYREGFRRKDDSVPEKFFAGSIASGTHSELIIDRNEFRQKLDRYYDERGWDKSTSKPLNETLERLGLIFTI